jgi:hypothetical protein
MDEMQRTQSLKEQQPAQRQRRLWRAPQFFVAGLASTLAQGNGGTDGANLGSTQS